MAGVVLLRLVTELPRGGVLENSVAGYADSRKPVGHEDLKRSRGEDKAPALRSGRGRRLLPSQSDSYRVTGVKETSGVTTVSMPRYSKTTIRRACTYRVGGLSWPLFTLLPRRRVLGNSSKLRERTKPRER